MIRLLHVSLVAIGVAGCQGASGYDGPPDHVAPTLEVDTPNRGASTEDAFVWVQGYVADEESGIESLTINGTPVEVRYGTAFEAEIRLREGVNLLRFRLTDRAGNETLETRAVVSGQFASAKSPVENGVAFGISRAPLNVIARAVEMNLKEIDWLPEITADGTIDLGFGGCLGAEFDVKGVSYDDLDVDFTPVQDGLRAKVRLSGLGLDTEVTYWVLCLEKEATVTFGTDRIELEIDFQIRMDDGKVSTDLRKFSTKVIGLGFDIDNAPEAVINMIQVDFAEVFGNVLGVVVSTATEPIINTAFQLLARGTTLEVLDTKIDVSFAARDLRFDTRGGLATFDSYIRAPDIRPPGYLYNPEPPPTPDRSPGLSVWIADDALNQMFYELWGAGVLDRRVDAGDRLGGLADSIELRPLLPPIISPATGSELDATLGDLLVSLYVDDATVAELAVSVDLDIAPRIGALGDLGLSVGTPNLIYDRLDDSGALTEQDIDLLSTLVTEVLRVELNSDLLKIPLPSFSEFSFANPVVRAQSGYVEIGAALKHTPPVETVEDPTSSGP